ADDRLAVEILQLDLELAAAGRMLPAGIAAVVAFRFSPPGPLGRILEAGLVTLDLERICALRMRVIRSLIGSCVDMSDPPYQLDLTRPGTRPLEPSSRSARRERLFLTSEE